MSHTGENMLIYMTWFTAGLILALLVRLHGVCFRRASFFRRFFASDLFYLMSGFVGGTSLTYAFILSGSLVLRSFGLPSLSALDLPWWASVPIALGLLDLGNYAAHFLMHRYDALWEIHKVHHSSRSLDWLATFRSHVLEQVLRRLIAPLVLISAG